MTVAETPTPTRAVASRRWLSLAIVTTVFWGVWGAFIELPEKAGFPATLGYVTWSITMLPCAAVALGKAGWRLERDARSVLCGAAVGLLGAGGQLMLFEALRSGPAYIVFPLVSLYPALTVIMSVAFLKERANRRSWTGIVLALAAIPLLSYVPPAQNGGSGHGWILLAAGVFLMWGVQAWMMKFATGRMRAESVFFYMALFAVLLAPVAMLMTDWSRPIEWGMRGPWAAAVIQVLNAIGALALVYALRYGRAIVVVPMTALAPVLTIVISLALYHVVPHVAVAAGMAIASVAIYLMAE